MQKKTSKIVLKIMINRKNQEYARKTRFCRKI